ncbi:RDD family protein [Kribbella sp. NBC_01245]|uniref:RDD family protein n=1 Tax=Kribbella sp. NBC_01245 TaxID=2903578 RepID=UPI002E2C2F1F|nr:RDD family protein [Kribbella sp. NBC_01245]
MSMYIDPVNVLGPQIAKRVAPLGDGRRYVRAGEWTRLFAWLVDFVVCVFGMGIGFVALALMDPGNDTLLLGLIGLLFGVPLVYGLFYGNGRVLGAVLTGTQLVRLKDGGRLGFWAPWAMLVRILLLPLVIFGVLVGSFGGGGSPPGTFYRVSLDRDATRWLWAAESASVNPS